MWRGLETGSRVPRQSSTLPPKPPSARNRPGGPGPVLDTALGPGAANPPLVGRSAVAKAAALLEHPTRSRALAGRLARCTPAAAAVVRFGGVTRDEIPTPALLLDLDRFERNLVRMAAHVARHGKSLRPHAKTHRSPEIARRQIAAGALGVAVAKLGEAEVMAAAGIRGLMITTEVVPPDKIDRLVRLATQAPDTLVVVDDASNARDLSRAAAAAGVVLGVLVDVDVGGRRTGIAPGEPALALAREVVSLPGLRLRGLQGYAGQCAHVVGWQARREASRAAMAPLGDTRRLLERAGLAVEIVAGGSTGTFDIDVEMPELTELQSGSYCVMDIDYRRIGGRGGASMTEFETALTVVATVVSVPTADRAMVDAGLKAFSTDKPFPPEAVERPGIEYSFAGDEHGRLTITDRDRAPKLGERIEFLPPHCDPTINLYDRIWAVRGRSVEAVWDVAARGRSD
ncbi:MAG: DSD1 family PLP-dependent enzyme [Candidatus Rokubacteria bacterium]|nr:DSD1 family PLP-dependent enzyme [Candidatus Rokubacteria bacterium]